MLRDRVEVARLRGTCVEPALMVGCNFKWEFGCRNKSRKSRGPFQAFKARCRPPPTHEDISFTSKRDILRLNAANCLSASRRDRFNDNQSLQSMSCLMPELSGAASEVLQWTDRGNTLEQLLSVYILLSQRGTLKFVALTTAYVRRLRKEMARYCGQTIARSLVDSNLSKLWVTPKTGLC